MTTMMMMTTTTTTTTTTTIMTMLMKTMMMISGIVSTGWFDNGADDAAEPLTHQASPALQWFLGAGHRYQTGTDQPQTGRKAQWQDRKACRNMKRSVVFAEPEIV